MSDIEKPPSIDTAIGDRDDEKKSNQLDGKPVGLGLGDDVEKKAGQEGEVDESRYLTGTKLFLVFVGFLLSVFLFALDQTIVSTAQPKIVSAFNSLEKIAWVTSGYFLTQAGLILTVGQILTVTSTKGVYLISIFFFELGSLICGVAPSIEVLIFGRAVAGVGAAGMFTSILSIIAEVTKLEDRPALFGSFGGVFAISSAIGPLLGGVFTDKVSWRWCFYINLPFGALAILSVIFFLDSKGSLKTEAAKKLTLKQKFMAIDYVGTILMLGFVTSLILALQWGGNQKPWHDKDVIATLVVAGVLLILFGTWEYYLGEEKAMVPLNLLKRRAQIGASVEIFFIFLILMIGTYFIPLWYQAKGKSASRSGIDIIPFMLAIVFTTGVSGGIISKTHRYWWFLVVTPPLASIASGLLYTINPDTPNSKLIGFQILLGVGVGGALQNCLTAVQTEYAREEHLIPQGNSFATFIQLLGGLIGVSIGSSIFGNQLATKLPQLAPDLSAAEMQAVRSSVTAIFDLPKEIQWEAIAAYSKALDAVFVIGVPAGALAAIFGLIVPNYNIAERSLTGTAAGGGVA